MFRDYFSIVPSNHFIAIEVFAFFCPISEKEPIPLERAALIEQAMAIRRSKLHILNELDRDQLDKLTELAIRALNLRIQNRQNKQ